MSRPTGRYIPVSYFRRLVTDLMYFSAKVPSVTIERRMDLAPLVAARQACTPQRVRTAQKRHRPQFPGQRPPGPL